MPKAVFLLVLSLFLVQTSIAFDCTKISLQNQATCNSILLSQLNQTEKDALLSNLDYNEKFYPDHSYVYQNNINLKISNAPENVSTKNGIYVRDAWMSIFAIMPSILYNNSLYVPDKALMLNGFNYKTEIPHNYYSGSPYTSSEGDCQRNYYLTQNTSENKVYVNGNYQGSGKLVNLSISSDSNVKAIYTINFDVLIYHYSWVRIKCLRSYARMCLEWKYQCKFSYQEIKQDKITIEDSWGIKHYQNILFANISDISYYNSNAKFLLNHSNSASLELLNAKYAFHDYTYSIAYSKEPYYVYTIVANDYKQTETRNMLKDGDYFIVKDIGNITLTANDFFFNFTKNIFFKLYNLNFFIKADKLEYKENETIHVSIYPYGTYAVVNYGNETKSGINEVAFTANHNYNVITAEYGSLKADTVIYISNNERTGFIVSLSTLGLLNCFFYSAVKRFSQGAL